MNWRYPLAARWRAEARKTGQSAEWYRRQFPENARVQKTARDLAQAARKQRLMAREMEAEI